jgi:zinc transport system substrate-binding protein
MQKKSLITSLVIILLIISFITGCNTSGGSGGIVEGKVNVVTSFFPLYDFATQIGGEHVNVINLIPTGVEPHDWTPKSRDMANLTKAQLFVYNGVGFEGWVEDFLQSMDKKSTVHIVEASKGVDLIRVDETEEEAHEEDDHGHEAEGEDAHKEDADGHEGEGEHVDEGDGHAHGEYDPHVWLSPLQAMKLAQNITAGLIHVDPAHKDDYEANYKELATKLNILHATFSREISAGMRKEIVVSHQAFGYLARDYGLLQVPIMGLSPEAEPTPQDLKNISNFIKEHDVKYILFEELVSPKLAKTLAEDLGIETVVLNPLEGLTEQQVKAGENYISMMERNLTSLKKALQ